MSWLAVAVPATLLSQQQRWTLCRAIERLTPNGAHRSRDRERMQQLGGLAAERAARVDRALYCFKLAAHFSVVRALIRGPDFRIACTGLEHVAAAVARGRGAVLWVSDFAGAGDVTKIALALAGHRVKHLSRVEHGFSDSAFGVRYLNPIRVRLEERYLAERVLFDRAHPATALLHLRRHLQANGVVSIAASAHEGRTLVEARFLRGRIRLATGALRLATLADAPLIPVFAIARPDEPGAFDLALEAPLTFPSGLSADQALQVAASEYLDHLEAHVTRRPECWVGWRRSEHFVGERNGEPATDRP